MRDCYVGYSLNKTNQSTITNSFKNRIKLNISSKEIVPSSFVIDKNSSPTVRHSFIVVYVVLIVFGGVFVVVFYFFPQIVICLHKGMLHELEFFLFDDENVNTKVAQNGSLPEVKRGTNNTVIYFCYYTPITCGKLLSLNFHCSALHVKEIAVNFVIIF